MAVTGAPRCPRLPCSGKLQLPQPGVPWYIRSVQQSPALACSQMVASFPPAWPSREQLRAQEAPALPWLPSPPREPHSLPPPAVLAPRFSHKLTFVPQAHLPLFLLGAFQPPPLSLKSQEWDSLAVQWLGLHASPAGGKGSIPRQGAKILHALLCGHQKKKVSQELDTGKLSSSHMILGSQPSLCLPMSEFSTLSLSASPPIREHPIPRAEQV